MQLGMAIIVSDEVHNTLRRLQLAVAHACGRNPALRQHPHITLKQPFNARALAPVETYFDSLAAEMRPLELRLSGIGAFEEDGVIYLAVEDEPRLEDLRQHILSELAERFRVKPRDIEGDRYRFHATVAYGLTSGELEAGLRALAGAYVDAPVDVNRIGLFYNTGDEWIIYKIARLRRAAGA